MTTGHASLELEVLRKKGTVRPDHYWSHILVSIYVHLPLEDMIVYTFNV